METTRRTSPDAGASGGHASHDPHLQHHFDSPDQQFGSSKLGMWLFLATELLMFGGLFCAYAIYRGNHPEIFRWGSVLLDRKMGAINTLILISSSFTMAAAVRSTQQGRRAHQLLFLSLTFAGACGFLGIKYMEYRPKFEHGLLWGPRFAPDESYVLAHFGGHGHSGEDTHAAGEAAGEEAAPVDLAQGRKILFETCASCHGRDLTGMPKNGKNLLTSQFVKDQDDEGLLAFLKVGRQPFDPLNTTGVTMPPRGGNPTLDDDKLRDVIASLRILQEEAVAGGEAGDLAGKADGPAGEPATAGEEDLWIPRSVIPPAPPAPAGIAVPAAPEPARAALPAPKNAHRFFAIYFLMTGLHGIHVIAGMLLIGWLIVGTALGRYGEDYFTPVDLVGLFWHLVDLIWIFLFPLFYLI